MSSGTSLAILVAVAFICLVIGSQIVNGGKSIDDHSERDVIRRTIDDNGESDGERDFIRRTIDDNGESHGERDFIRQTFDDHDERDVIHQTIDDINGERAFIRQTFDDDEEDDEDDDDNDDEGDPTKEHADAISNPGRQRNVRQLFKTKSVRRRTSVQRRRTWGWKR